MRSGGCGIRRRLAALLGNRSTGHGDHGDHGDHGVALWLSRSASIFVNALAGTIGTTVGFFGALGATVTLAVALARRQLHRCRGALGWIAVMSAGCLLAVTAMESALLADDFTVAYVARNSTIATPLLYKIATLWGALEGSILLWALVLCGYVGAAALRFRKRIDEPLVAWALLVMSCVCVFFFALLVGPASPFDVLDSPPADGGGLNPLLRNHPLMAVHPIALYLGYVGLTVPFGFALAALITGRVERSWLSDIRRPTLFAWGCLSVGIVLGAWWSYEVLGWGGYWAWDPVENASLLPWLTSTAFIHSLIVQERRGMLRVWNLSLLIASFALTIFGTFLTRSGVLDSVHEFSESTLGPLLLAFFAVIVAVSVVLLAWRADLLRTPGAVGGFRSREGSFAANNLLFSVAAFVVLAGTVFPLVVEAVSGDRLAVGRPYFDRMLAPVGLALLALMGLGPQFGWRSTRGARLSAATLGPAAAAAAVMTAAVWAGARGLWPTLGLGLGGFAVASAVAVAAAAVRRRGWRGLLGRTGGGMIAHIGFGLLAFGFVAANSFSSEGEFTLAVGETAAVAGRQVAFLGMTDSVESGNRVVRAVVDVQGRGVFEPAVTRFSEFGQPISTPSVATSLVDDVYLSLVTLPDPEAAEVTLRVLIKPLVVWMWLGGGVLGLGVLLALVPDRRARLGDRVRPGRADRPGSADSAVDADSIAIDHAAGSASGVHRASGAGTVGGPTSERRAGSASGVDRASGADVGVDRAVSAGIGVGVGSVGPAAGSTSADAAAAGNGARSP